MRYIASPRNHPNLRRYCIKRCGAILLISKQIPPTLRDIMRLSFSILRDHPNLRNMLKKLFPSRHGVARQQRAQVTQPLRHEFANVR